MVNKVIIVGRAGKDAEVKKFENNEVCNISLAVTEKYKDKAGENHESTEWFNVEVWGKMASICGQYVKKGSLIYVDGKLKTVTYDKDGEKRSIVKVVSSEIKFLSYSNEKKDNNTSGQATSSNQKTSSKSKQTEQQPQNFGSEEDLPF